MAGEDVAVVDEPKVGTDGKHPETVSWSQYVGIKESLGKKIDTATLKVQGLEEQLNKAPNPEEFGRIKTELDEIKIKHKTISDELNTTKERSLSEKRASLVARGVPADKVKDMSEKELDAVSGVLGVIKGIPKADLGGGGGSGSPDKAKDRIKQGFQVLHPQ